MGKKSRKSERKKALKSDKEICFHRQMGNKKNKSEKRKNQKNVEKKRGEKEQE